MEPTKLDEPENKVMKATHRLSSYLIESKIEDWNTQLHQEKPDTCEKCGSKLKNNY